MEIVVGGLLCVGGGIVLFGGLALLTWLEQKGKDRRRELEHRERMQALELGHPLPDVKLAQARADSSRAWAAGFIGVLVPLGMGFGAMFSTALILDRGGATGGRWLVGVVWSVAGAVILTTVYWCIRALQRPAAPGETAPAPAGVLADREMPLDELQTGVTTSRKLP